jgi:hypothetical protein
MVRYMKILLFGNCQLWAIKETLKFNSSVSVTYIACHSTDMIATEFTTLIQESDIIVTQPIKDAYRGSTYLSTSYIINTARSDCKIIIVDSCYFVFYYFDLTYKFHNGSLLQVPHDYHYNGLVDSFKRSLPIAHYIDNYVNNPTLKSCAELGKLANNSLAELKLRYERNCESYGQHTNVSILTTYDFIKDNYKKCLLFYSMNHPTKHLIQHICQQIRTLIGVECVILDKVDCLGGSHKSILYACIQPMVEFDIRDHQPLTLLKTTPEDIARVYYDTYKTIL